MSLEKRIRKLFFELVPFRTYLFLVSKVYFLTYNLGLLKKNTTFKYHYFLKNLINRDDIIIDIGANLGYYTIPYAKHVGPQGFVYAIEPVQVVREVLEKNIGRRKNIQILPYALGTESKHIRMGNNTRKHFGVVATGSHFVLEEDANALDEFTAEMKIGSEIFKNLERLDFIKCDVEGYETVIIPEMEKILIEHKPTMLIETRREKRVFLLDYLMEIGFLGYVLEGGKLYPAKDIEEKMEDDIIFIHKEKVNRYNKFFSLNLS